MRYLILNCSPVRDGATAEIAGIVASRLNGSEVRSVCIDDYEIAFCKGCRACHKTARCVRTDGTDELIAQLEWADVIVAVSPSYWADVPGQFKAFIDRCTPWCNTHEPHAALSPGKKGYVVALRTGPGVRECQRIVETIEHFYGHMEIGRCGSLCLTSVEYKADVAARTGEILAFCQQIVGA